MKNFCKAFWLPALLFIAVFSFAGYMCWKEEACKNSLIERALKGDQVAVALLEKYEKPWTLDKRILDEALNNNSYALQILGIEPKDSK